jgi:hypothetical protein
VVSLCDKVREVCTGWLRRAQVTGVELRVDDQQPATEMSDRGRRIRLRPWPPAFQAHGARAVRQPQLGDEHLDVVLRLADVVAGVQQVTDHHHAVGGDPEVEHVDGTRRDVDPPQVLGALRGDQQRRAAGQRDDAVEVELRRRVVEPEPRFGFAEVVADRHPPQHVRDRVGPSRRCRRCRRVRAGRRRAGFLVRRRG